MCCQAQTVICVCPVYASMKKSSCSVEAGTGSLKDLEMSRIVGKRGKLYQVLIALWPFNVIPLPWSSSLSAGIDSGESSVV